jgi:hypothetical protein
MTTSRLFVGASGYSFKEWKGNFYPEGIKPDAMLAYYAERLPKPSRSTTPSIACRRRTCSITGLTRISHQGVSPG